jgi:transposase
MLSLPSSVRIFLARDPANFHWGIDRLAALVVQSQLDLYSGHLFVFLSNDRSKIKILTWERGGFALWYKRFEQGRLRLPTPFPGATLELDAGQLAFLLEGLEPTRIRRMRVWTPPAPRPDRERGLSAGDVSA